MENSKFSYQRMGVGMKTAFKNPPRKYRVGKNQAITIHDTGSLLLDIDEQITFLTEDGKEYDVCRKEWGYYATPSLNDRLRKNGFLSVLVKNASGHIYLWLVEEEKQTAFKRYLEAENQHIVEWLHEDSQCPICGKTGLDLKHIYQEKPEREIPLPLSPYYREIHQCRHCQHFINVHDYNLDSLYQEDYVTHTYHTSIELVFKKIISLPAEKSDNRFRVQRIINFVKRKKAKILDIGSGPCVFLYQIQKETEWECTALDPDKRQSDHGTSIGIDTIHTDFMLYNGTKKFDIITLNKILEHIKDPVKFLTKTKKHLAQDGIIYVELPDGEASFKNTPNAQEFFLEHFHIFSMKSIIWLVEKVGFVPLKIERLVEPSGKCTLYIFCKQP